MKSTKLLTAQMLAVAAAFAGPEMANCVVRVSEAGEVARIMPTPPRLGLRQRIAQAKSVEEINNLLEISTGYRDASDVTRRSWKTTARRRLKELGVEK